MPLFNGFSHYLAYGATDQETFRALRDCYEGLLVPGTIAAWQQQGTGGFVLALSATQEAPPYVIDPRFPLFQQGLRDPKQSHVALAELFGDSELIQPIDPLPSAFNDQRLRDIARCWVAFNARYGSSASEKFDKYARRLGTPVVRLEDARGPEALLAPYFVASHSDDPWWERSAYLYRQTVSQAGSASCIRVVAAIDPRGLDSLLSQVPETEIAIWVSGLDEYQASAHDLRLYRSAIAAAGRRGKRLFGLYGGFFSVLLKGYGLSGCAHGVGFSEHRLWRELPQSGAPPARYYARRFHRFISQELAQLLWQENPSLVECDCQTCERRPPVELDYHDLMKHSVICRNEEIQDWGHLGNAAAISQRLRAELNSLEEAIELVTLPPAVRGRAGQAIDHFSRWIEAVA